MKASLQIQPMYCSREYNCSSRFNQQYEKSTPNLDVKLSLHGQSRSFEYAVWECNISNMLLTLVGIYHPPYSDMTKVTDAMFLDDLAEFLETMLTTYSNIVVSGDFNLHIDDIGNPDAQVFLDLMTVFWVTEPCSL